MDTPSRTRPMGLEELLRLADHPRRWGCPILDIRPPHLARRGHLRGSAWLPVADPGAIERDLPSHLLPSRGARIAVVSQEPLEARFVAEHLAQRGFACSWLEVPLAGIPFDPGPPRGALWMPDPYLLERFPLLPGPEAGPVGDLGSGNGRNAVFLASRGHRVHCIDRLPDALELARDRALRMELPIETHQLNLMGGEDLPGGPFGSILMLRFVQKSLLAEMIRHLRPRGVLLVHTYSTAPPTHEGAGTGPQRPRYLLSAAEVGELLPETQWEFLHRSAAFAREGRTMIGFVARLRG